ncbi:hypothetical protein [Nonomuraea sp. NPDC048826]|uniref:hypothetical protein n=1 Tax=Nonomuraea sp. NPDC048826 TaxID=3364347 RepID=UPI0037192E54
MDRPPRGSQNERVASQRVVEVHSGHDDLAGATGSGYVVGPGLVLTSAYLVDPAAPCHVRGDGARAAAEPVWRGSGSLAATLLRVTDPGPWTEPPGTVRWGRITGDEAPCVVRGRAAVPGAGVVPGAAGAEAGTVPAVAGAGVGVVPVSLRVELAGPPPRTLAGAAVLAEPTGQLVGVLVCWYEDGRADVVPAEALLLDDDFRAWAGGSPGVLEDVSGDERVVLLPELLEPVAVQPPEDCPDWSLPAARHAVVPFVGRKAELAALRTWAAGPEPVSAALVTGPGGAGKSRLAVELGEELAAAGWDTGLLTEASLVGPLSDPAVRLDALRPTLLVLDFPEPSAALAAELARRLAGHRHNPRVRLLLVARASAGAAPPSAAWWRRLDTAAGGRLKRLVHTTIRLEDHPLTLPERAEHAAAAIRAFAARSRQGDEAGGGLDRIRPFPLDDPLYAVPLRVHLAALMRVRGHEAGPGNELIHRFLGRERERWSRSPGAPDAGVAEASVALALLVAPSPGELGALLSVVPGLKAERRADVAGWVSGLLPPPGAPGVPDGVVGQLLEETAGLESLVTAAHDHPGRTAAHLARMLDVLRVGADHPRVRAALRSLVVHRLDRMLVEAAMGPGEQLVDRIDAVLRLLAGEPEVAAAVAALPPWQAGHHGVRALKVTLAEMLVERRRGGKRADLATALSTSSACLAAVGRLPEAVAAARQAADIFAAAPPYEQAEGHAEALFNQAACLLLSEVPEVAQRPAREAVARFGILAEEDPRYAAHAERARYNLACALAGAGRLREAVAGFVAAGGDALLAEDVTAVLTVLPGGASPPARTGFFAGAGSYGGAVEPLGPLGPLDELDEGRLLGLGARLAVMAAEAVRGVAVTDQEVCRRLYRLGVRLDRQGRGEAAVVVAGEAVVRLRGIAAEEPGLRAVLAAAAGLVSRVHAERGELEAAVRGAEEAVDNLRALVVLEPGRHRRDLAGRLSELGEYLLLRRRSWAAAEVLREAVWVAGGLGDGHARLVAGCRRLLGVCLVELGRLDDALAQFEAAAGLLGELDEEDAALRRDVEGWVRRTLTLLGRRAAFPAPPPGLGVGARMRGGLSLAGMAVRPGESVERAEQALAVLTANGADGAADGAERWLPAACALTGLGRWAEAEEIAGRVVEQVREPLQVAVALRVLAGARFARGDFGGASEAAGAAVRALPEEATVPRRLLAGTCLQLRGLCRAHLDDDERAGLDLVRGTTLIAGLLDEHGPLDPELAGTHLLALLALGELQRDPAPFLARALEVRPVPPPEAVRALLDELADHLDGPADGDLLGPLTAFAEAFIREVPVGAEPGLHESLGECLERYAALTGEAAAAEAAVRVFEGPATTGEGYRERLGGAFAVLAGIEHEQARPVLATLERAADLLAGSSQGAALASTLALYGDTLLAARRPVEALAQLERAADLCDELDEPGVAAMAYAGLGAALAALDRPQAALEAVAWSAAEQERMPRGRAAARARADEVRGLVLRRMGRRREALAHLVEAVDQHRTLPRTPARRLAVAEVAVVIVDDLLADGRADEAVEYALLAVDGYAGCPPARLKHALAKQRLVRCHLMCGALGEAAPLVEELIVDARRATGDLTYRAVLADSLAQSAELLTMLHLDDGPKAEARAREAIGLYDELIAAGVAAEGVHAGRAGANLSLAAALAAQERYEDEVAPLREAVSALERYAPGDPLLGGHLARALLMLGDALMAAGRAPEASAVLHRGTRVIGDGYLSVLAHYQLGLCELRLGRDEAADAALRAADGRLRELLGEEEDEELVEMHRDVLRARLELHERAGRAGEVALVERDLIDLRWFRPR